MYIRIPVKIRSESKCLSSRFLIPIKIQVWSKNSSKKLSSLVTRLDNDDVADFSQSLFAHLSVYSPGLFASLLGCKNAN